MTNVGPESQTSSARLTFNAARYFWRQAALSGVEDREAFAYNVNAAVVFGRSVTWHLQKQYANQNGFDAWYAGEQAILKGDAACKFFNDTRLDLPGYKWCPRLTKSKLIDGSGISRSNLLLRTAARTSS